MKIHQIDLHCHAGKSLKETLSFAHSTWRRIVGITEVIYNEKTETFENGSQNALSLEDFLQLRAEVDQLKSEFPDMQLFLAPEISAAFDYTALDDRCIAASDYVFCLPEEGKITTECMLSQLERAYAISRHTGKSTILAYPFRSLWISRIQAGHRAPEKYVGPKGLTDEAVISALGFDLHAFAHMAVSLGVAVEINGETYSRVRSYNHPYYYDVLQRAYEILHRRGVSLVPGSGLRGFRPGKSGLAVPEETFALLGISGSDIRFLDQIGAKRI